MNLLRSLALYRPRRWRGGSDWPAKAVSCWEPRIVRLCGCPDSAAGSTLNPRLARCVRTRVKYVDTSAILRILFSEAGPAVVLVAGDRAVSSQLAEVEAFRAIDRERLLGNLNDTETAVKRKELTDLLAMLDLAPIDRLVIDRAKSSFAVNVRALDALHVATAEILAHEAGGELFEFWTHDRRQGTAALSRGLTVCGIDPQQPLA